VLPRLGFLGPRGGVVGEALAFSRPLSSGQKASAVSSPSCRGAGEEKQGIGGEVGDDGRGPPVSCAGAGRALGRPLATRASPGPR
jgi:hypothetical protein